MDASKIRESENLTDTKPVVATVLPPREGFSPDAVGAIGLLVHRLGQPGDIVIGQAKAALTFSGRRFEPAPTVFWPPFGRVERYMAGVEKVLRRLQPDLIEVHNRANLAWRLADALPSAKIVLFLHNDPQGMRRAKRPADRAALLAKVTTVCVSEYLRGRFMQGMERATTAPLVLPNSLDLAALPNLSPDAGRDKIFLFVGRIVANKGADAFVDACAKILPSLPGWRAAMIGADRFAPYGRPTTFEAELRPRAAEAGIDMRGYLPHAEVLQAMARAAIVAVPSRWPEPFGLTALEAMACGAALVCGARGGLPEVAGDAALYIDPDIPGDLATALAALATDPPRRAALAQAGRVRAQTFDAAEARARLAALRAQLLAASPA